MPGFCPGTATALFCFRRFTGINNLAESFEQNLLDIRVAKGSMKCYQVIEKEHYQLLLENSDEEFKFFPRAVENHQRNLTMKGPN